MRELWKGKRHLVGLALTFSTMSGPHICNAHAPNIINYWVLFEQQLFDSVLSLFKLQNQTSRIGAVNRVTNFHWL